MRFSSGLMIVPAINKMVDDGAGQYDSIPHLTNNELLALLSEFNIELKDLFLLKEFESEAEALGFIIQQIKLIIGK